MNDTPAEIVTELGETLRQTPMGVALSGDTTHYTGPARSTGYRWFTDPAAWQIYAPEEHPHEVKHFIHPEVGALELTCQRLVDPGQAHSLLVYTAIPGSESHEKLQVLSVIGTQTLR
ncbi:hypothetical protein AB0L53_43780 [Nonomuraea sp. NPDC052129]|uniref:MmyB family transcriptional regulator n=1 Tax=Nonomuraea sp. NPDC052129 TaxID=3154651 RepID=UPI00342E164A